MNLNPKQTPKNPKRGRFDKLVNHIVQKSSPSMKDNNMAVEDEEEAIDQEGKKLKLKNVDLPGKAFH